MRPVRTFAVTFTLACLILRTVAQDGVTNTVAYAGTTATINCPLTGVTQALTWRGPPNDIVYYDPGANVINPNIGEIASRLSAATNQSLILSDIKLDDAITFKCVTLINGQRTEGLNNLIVRIRPTALEISSSVTEDSKGLRSTEGRPFTVHCTSTGGYPAPNVVLYKGGINVPGNTSLGVSTGNTFTVTLTVMVTPVRQDDQKQLQCLSFYPTPINAQDSQRTRPLLLYLYLKPREPIVSQPPSVVAGEDVTVECRTSGSRPPAIISWTGQGETNTPRVSVTNDTTTQTFTTVSMLQWQVTAADNGQMVVCRVSHRALDNNLTASVSLNVRFQVELSTTTISGNSIIVANGANQLSLVCTTGSSNPPAAITWSNGSDIIRNSNMYTDTSGAYHGIMRSQTLQLKPTRYDHGNNISCSAGNDVNQFTDSTTVTLTLHFTPLVTISTPSSHTLTEEPPSPSTVLPCSADSNPLPTITWYHNGQAVTPKSLGSSLSYTIREANRTSYGNYTCTAVNIVPPANSKSYTIDVLFSPFEVSINKPTGDVIANGQTPMSISCTAGTSNPVSEITWITGNVGTSTPSHVDKPGEYGGIVRTSTIRFNATRDHDGLTIKCEAGNNITGLHKVSNSTIIDNIIYAPLIIDIIPNKDVVEGKTVMLPCYASSKPPASFTWLKGSVKLESGQGTAFYNGLNYTINNASRFQTGMYTCNAVGLVAPNDSKNTLLTVLYPPDITVSAINTTVNSSETTVTCEASGVPARYAYKGWVHTWNGHVVTHPGPLPSTKVLTLTNLSYAHSGVYTCGVSNGVKNVSYGSGSLFVKSPPIVVGDVANTLELKASGQLMKETKIAFQYYSNAGRGLVTVQKTNDTGAYVGDVQFRDVYIRLPVFSSTINTTGTEAIINISLANMSQFGGYDIYVANEISSVHLSLIIQPFGPPESPVFVNKTILDHQSVTIMWISGFPNGLNQTFVIQLSTDNSTWWNISQYGGMAYQQEHNQTIVNLASNQIYFVRMFAFNAEGESEPTDIYYFKTASSPNTEASPFVALIAGGAAAGVVAAAVVIVVIIVVVRRWNAVRMQGSTKDKGALVMSSNHNEGYDNGDEEVINRLYESAGVNETDVDAPTSKQVPPADVENIYSKVNKKPEGKKMEILQNPNAVKYQKDGKKKKEKHAKNKHQIGDVYENAPSIMSGNRSWPQSGEIVYEDTSMSAPAAPKKLTGVDELLYADLEFAPKKKGPTKIIGLEDMCEYTTIDLTKKAQPLPDSDDEDMTKHRKS